ncbi:MAG TPA: trypsin-like peptidase domain-containing protein, partial [Marmoricola sp.]|nr:trypsin-like peptidase domain-containing protein [Marmoricola sp.]
CGAVGGPAIGEAIHGSSDGNTAANGSGFPMVNRSRPDFGYQTQQSGTQETTSTATGSQLVGLVRLQVTLGYQNGAAVGTGMILNSTGKVVTNHHVIEGATKILATDMSTGKRYVATLVGSDSSDDIAVLQLQGASGLATVHPSTATAAVGQTVTAVGDAQGATTLTASPGKVTALNQTISPSDSSSAQNETLTGIIQYAADVMSGDSGGATYDSSGSVIGMTTAASAGGMQTNGYAIPISKVLSVATDLGNSVANTKYVYGLPAFIGVGVSQSDVVEQVYAGTGAATSGLVPGDRIVAIDGTTISNASQLQAATRQRQVGDTLQVTWTTSADKRHSATIRLISGPAR